MSYYKQLLPGGLLLEDGTISGAFQFQPITGWVEVELEKIRHYFTVAEQVTYILSLALKHLAGKKPSWDLIHSLCIGDRQFLMRELAIELDITHQWHKQACQYCTSYFDYFIALADLPLLPSQGSYPFAYTQTSLGYCKLRLPNGYDQTEISVIDSLDEAIKQLAHRCILTIDESEVKPEEKNKLSGSDIEAIDQALEKTAPQITNQIQVECPECKEKQVTRFDFYQALLNFKTTIYNDVVYLSQLCHWQEKHILSMPRSRRLQYIKLKDTV